MADTTLKQMGDEQKPVPQPAAPPASAEGGNWWSNFTNYLKETQAEAKRVAWPSKTDWTNSSIITLLTIIMLSAVMALYNMIANALATFFFG